MAELTLTPDGSGMMAEASREAMTVFAYAIYEANPGLSHQLRRWVKSADCASLVNDIQEFITYHGFTWTVERIAEEYRKHVRCAYVSCTAKIVIDKFKNRLQLHVNSPEFIKLIRTSGEISPEAVKPVMSFGPASEISDGYHTFEELYSFRKMYNCLLFNEWAKAGKYNVHKSKRHFTGELCFGGDWFIVTAVLPTGQISNHYKLEDWDLFKVPDTEKSEVEFDGHTGIDVLVRMRSLNDTL